MIDIDHLSRVTVLVAVVAMDLALIFLHLF